jgi:hypothetical protein
MSSMSDFMGDVAREAVTPLLSKEFAKGYDEAANICMRILSKKIEDLLNQVTTGRYMSEQEQFLLSSLYEIRAETEVALNQ